MLLGVVGGQGHGNHEVGGVARGGQRSPPFTGLVQWRQVAGPLEYVHPLTGLQPHLEESVHTTREVRLALSVPWQCQFRQHCRGFTKHFQRTVITNFRARLEIKMRGENEFCF